MKDLLQTFYSHSVSSRFLKKPLEKIDMGTKIRCDFKENFLRGNTISNDYYNGILRIKDSNQNYSVVKILIIFYT